MTPRPEISANRTREKCSESADGPLLAGLPGSSLPPVICVASNDRVWARLLAQNLAARGASTIQSDLSDLKLQIPMMPDRSWIVIDGGWPMIDLQGAIEELNPVLTRFNVKSVVVVDELVGHHPVSSFKPDMVIKRAPDMRVLVRDLLTIFRSNSPERPDPAL